MNVERQPSFSVTVYVAGDYQTARESLRRECFERGMCVTVTPTTFVYTAGAEDGVAVGFVNYPRFPSGADEIVARALEIAQNLMADLCQWSALVVTPVETIWLNNRPQNQPNR